MLLPGALSLLWLQICHLWTCMFGGDRSRILAFWNKQRIGYVSSYETKIISLLQLSRPKLDERLKLVFTLLFGRLGMFVFEGVTRTEGVTSISAIAEFSTQQWMCKSFKSYWKSIEKVTESESHKAVFMVKSHTPREGLKNVSSFECILRNFNFHFEHISYQTKF